MAEIPGVDYGNNTQAAVDALRGVMQSYFDDALSLDEMLEEAENIIQCKSASSRFALAGVNKMDPSRKGEKYGNLLVLQ